MDKQDKMKALDLMIVLGGKKDGEKGPKGMGPEGKGMGEMRCPKCGEVCVPDDAEDDEEYDMED